MSYHEKIADWTAIIVASGLGFLVWWAVQSNGFSENTARAAAYTTGIFFMLALALRPAWRRLRLWGDLGILFLLHVALLLPVLKLLDSHSIRLNWAIALPFLALELMLFLSLLWRRNMAGSSSKRGDRRDVF
jgi:hypothetical protein